MCSPQDLPGYASTPKPLFHRKTLQNFPQEPIFDFYTASMFTPHKLGNTIQSKADLQALRNASIQRAFEPLTPVIFFPGASRNLCSLSLVRVFFRCACAPRGVLRDQNTRSIGGQGDPRKISASVINVNPLKKLLVEDATTLGLIVHLVREQHRMRSRHTLPFSGRVWRPGHLLLAPFFLCRTLGMEWNQARGSKLQARRRRRSRPPIPSFFAG